MNVRTRNLIDLGIRDVFDLKGRDEVLFEEANEKILKYRMIVFAIFEWLSIMLKPMYPISTACIRIIGNKTNHFTNGHPKTGD